MRRAHLGRREDLVPVAPARVALVGLELFAIARELDLSGVRDDHESARINGGIVRRQILRTEFVGNDDGETAQHLVLRVNEEPRTVLARIRSMIALLHLLFSLSFMRICAPCPGFCPRLTGRHRLDPDDERADIIAKMTVNVQVG